MKSYAAKLTERVTAQAAACIGCNDCLLACPIPESRSVTIAELNAAVRLPVIHAEHVVRFLDACTQCKQCVPACPADLNRAEMVLVNKLKVEDAIPDHELLLQSRERVSPSGFTLGGLAEGLGALELFRGVAPLVLRRMLQKLTLRRLEAGEVLCKDGDFYEHLVVVLSGSLVQTLTGPTGELFYLVGLGPGSFLGEIGVLGDCPEPHGAIAREPSVVLEAPKLAVLRAMEQAPTFAETLDREYARHALWNHARKPGSLGGLPEAAILELFADARLELCAAGQHLFEEGEPPRDFFLVRSGFLRAVKLGAGGERVLTYFREGDALGLASLLGREAAQSYGAHAVARAEVVRVSAEALGRVLSRHPEAYPKLMESALAAERLARSAEVGVGPMNFALEVPASGFAGRPSALSGMRAPLEAGVLVEEGIAKGREVLVVDQNLCTSCGNCIDACERRHGTSRLKLRGLQVEHYMFPTACRHCADPACLLCSVNGIVRLPSGEIQIVEDNCIGCGACAERCPYGNISMHAVEQPKRGFLPSLFDFLVRGTTSERALDAIDPKVQRIAVKCDLCAGHADHACVTACPVGANFRVDPGSLVEKR